MNGTNEANVTGVLAGLAASDLDRTIAWLTTLLGRVPDARPMEGLAEWNLAGAATLQVTLDAERAGGSTITFVVADIEVEQARLDGSSIQLTYDDQTSDVVKFAELTDPDGNAIAIVEAKSGSRAGG